MVVVGVSGQQVEAVAVTGPWAGVVVLARQAGCDLVQVCARGAGWREEGLAGGVGVEGAA
jgi:hypothetical protein